MKLLRYGPAGFERPGLLADDGSLLDLSPHLPDIGPAQLQPEALARIAALRAAGDLKPVRHDGVAPRLGPPLAGTAKFIGIGLNYRDHAAESGVPVPKEPVIFLKATSCIQGPNDPVMLPRDSVKTDWEVELGVVIGQAARHVPQERALDHVAGYLVVHDLSEREFQLERGPQWDKGKGCDTFGPLGPWLVTRDEVPDPQNLPLWLDVNGQRRQTGQTGQMVFGVAEIVAYVSRFMTLHPGDVIATGTPPGVGMGMKPPQFLRAGDVVTLGIDGLGSQRQTVVAWQP